MVKRLLCCKARILVAHKFLDEIDTLFADILPRVFVEFIVLFENLFLDILIPKWRLTTDKNVQDDSNTP